MERWKSMLLLAIIVISLLPTMKVFRVAFISLQLDASALSESLSCFIIGRFVSIYNKIVCFSNRP